MNAPIDFYLEKIAALTNSIRRDEAGSIAAAAQVLKEQIARDRLITVFGVSGHSVIGCEEFFWRAGGLACINPLFDQSLNLSGGGLKSTRLERVPGIGDKALAGQAVEPGGVIILTSIYGMNAATIDAALQAKEKGLTLIAITSRQHADNTPRNFPARHPSGRNLGDIADVTIDNHVPHGDCLVQLSGLDQPLGPCSTILVSFCVQWLVMEAVQLCLQDGISPPVWRSANTVGGDEANAEFLARFLPRVKAL